MVGEEARRARAGTAAAADAELGGEAVIGSPLRREGAAGEDQPAPVICHLAEQAPGADIVLVPRLVRNRQAPADLA